MKRKIQTEIPLNKEDIVFYGETEEDKKKNETIFDMSMEIDRLSQTLNKIYNIVNRKDITGIEAKLMIIDILNEMKEGNDDK